MVRLASVLAVLLLAAGAVVAQADHHPGVVTVFDTSDPGAPVRVDSGIAFWVSAGVAAVVTDLDAVARIPARSLGRERPEIPVEADSAFDVPELGITVLVVPDSPELRALEPFELAERSPTTEEVLYRSPGAPARGGVVMGPHHRDPRLIRVGVNTPLPNAISALLDDRGRLAAVAIQRNGERVKVPLALTSEALAKLLQHEIRGRFDRGRAAAPAESALPRRRVSTSELVDMARERPEPAFPAMAKAVGVEGAVVVEVIVDESGRVSAARALSGHPLLRDAAVEAARRWTFAPQAERLVGTLSFSFTRPADSPR